MKLWEINEKKRANGLLRILWPIVNFLLLFSLMNLK